MKTFQEQKSIKDLAELFSEHMMIANPEYQRGVVWTESQQKRLIDSIFRGFTLPLIYLHKKKKKVADMTREGLEIIDGQQRLTAIYRYCEGAFRLFDPKTENDKARFPRFLLEQECPWGGKYFRELDSELQDRFHKTELLLTMIQSEDTNEIRDLFVRLQAGSDLNAQERRDAMPGGMNDFVLGLGGKPQMDRYPGHDFFKETMSARPGSDRGKTRQLAAQVASLLLAQKKFGSVFPDINTPSIDQFYYENLDFDSNGSDAQSICKTFDLLHTLLRDGKRPNLKSHDVIHAALFVNRLRDEFTPIWREEFTHALDSFLSHLKEANVLAKKHELDESDPRYQYLSQYGNLTRSSADKGENISRRHSFYVKKMLEKMPETKRLDTKRGFSDPIRELIYFQQRKTCAVCGSEIQWSDVEIHHVTEYQKGGKTTIENAALVHKECHPKSETDVAEFANQWMSK